MIEDRRPLDGLGRGSLVPPCGSIVFPPRTVGRVGTGEHNRVLRRAIYHCGGVGGPFVLIVVAGKPDGMVLVCHFEVMVFVGAVRVRLRHVDGMF